MDYRELESMLCDEIDRIVDRKDLTNASLDTLDKLTHTLKSIKTIEAMDGYSEDSMSYARRRDSRGRYTEGRYDGKYNERYGRY